MSDILENQEESTPPTLEERVTILENELSEAKNSINSLLTKIETLERVLDFFNVNKDNGTLIFTELEYKKLSEEEKNNGKIFLIKD